MDTFACGLSNKVKKMTEFKSDDFFDVQDNGNAEFAGESLTEDADLLMEDILQNINNTPLGQVLQKIACLPEVSQKKVLGVRQQLTEGQYDFNDRLDIALDKVIEDLTT